MLDRGSGGMMMTIVEGVCECECECKCVCVLCAIHHSRCLGVGAAPDSA